MCLTSRLPLSTHDVCNNETYEGLNKKDHCSIQFLPAIKAGMSVAKIKMRKQNLHSLYLKLSPRYSSFQYVTFQSWNAAGNVNCPLAAVPPPSAVTALRTDGANFTAEALKQVESMTTL